MVDVLQVNKNKPSQSACQNTYVGCAYLTHRLPAQRREQEEEKA